MDPLDGPKTFHSLPPELRNTVYRLHFDTTTQAIDHNDSQPKGKGRPRGIKYTPANSLHEAVGIFLASHLVYSETRGLFLLEYCRGARFSLRNRHSIYAFSRLTDPLFQGTHRIDLSATREVQCRRTLNPIRLALQAALLTAGDQDTLSFHKSEPEDDGLPLTITAKLKLADNEFQLVIKHLRAGKISFQLTGPITKLDWSFIPLMRYTERSEGWLRAMSPEVLGVRRNRLRRFAPRPDTQAMVLRDELDNFMGEAEAELRSLPMKPMAMSAKAGGFGGAL